VAARTPAQNRQFSAIPRNSVTRTCLPVPLGKYHPDVVRISGDVDILHETQLSLTNRATRLEVSQGEQTLYHLKREV